MEKFSSNSSRLVKLITLSTFTLLVLVAFVLIIVEGRLGSVSGIIFLVVVMGSAFYFYSQSLKELIITDTHLILKKNLSKVVIDFEDIESVVKLKYADIPMVIGSKGVFGLLGKTMDGSTSYVKNRKKMVHIITADKKYLISCDERDAFVEKLKQKTNC